MEEKRRSLLKNVTGYRGVAGGMSDRYLVQAKVEMRASFEFDREGYKREKT